MSKKLKLDGSANEVIHLCWGEDKECKDKAHKHKCYIMKRFNSGRMIGGKGLKACQKKHGKEVPETPLSFLE